MAKGLAILLGHQASHEDPEEESGHDLPPALVAAGEEVMHSIRGGNGQAFAEALCDFLELYESQPHEEYPHEGEGEQ